MAIPRHITPERETEYSGTSVSDVHYVVKLNELEVAVINERYVDLQHYFQLSEIDRYVIILSTANGGSGCPQKLVLICRTGRAASRIWASQGLDVADFEAELNAESAKLSKHHEEYVKSLLGRLGISMADAAHN